MTASPTATIVPPNVTADMLTTLIDQHPLSESRIKRGAALVRAHHVEATATAGVVLVRSASTDNRAYRVDAYACGCMDHQSREIFCQHQAARALWLAGLRAETDQEQAADPDAPITLELTGRAYLTLLRPTALPPVAPAIQRVPVVLRGRALVAEDELYGDDYSGDAA